MLWIILLLSFCIIEGRTASVALSTSASSPVGTLDLTQANASQPLSYEVEFSNRRHS
jgi:hypothetical protein